MHRILALLISSLFLYPLSISADLNPLLQSTTKYDKVVVEKVLKTDTLLLKNGEKVALIGLEVADSPKVVEVNRDEHGFIIPDNDPTTPLDIEALQFVKKLAENQIVHLEFDTQRRNDNGILLAYVILPDGRMLNEEELRYGYAQLKLSIPNMKYAQRLRDAYKEARHEMRGMQGNW